MTHLTTPEFWDCYHQLPPDVRKLADKNFQLLKLDPRHPSLHFKKVGNVWSVRVGREYRALADEENGEFTWFWIGPHDEYERLISS
ncbi:MAG: type II toxin-antitoxin system RelE/ParE family toxin [Planctomycetaceae bacterium]